MPRAPSSAAATSSPSGSNAHRGAGAEAEPPIPANFHALVYEMVRRVPEGRVRLISSSPPSPSVHAPPTHLPLSTPAVPFFPSLFVR